MWLVVPSGTLPARAGIISSCPGDCNGDGVVLVNELIIGVNIALGLATVSSCPSLDRRGDGVVTIDDLIAAVNAALNGCPATPTATATTQASATSTPSASATRTPSGSRTPTRTPTATATGIPTGTASATATATAVPTGTASATATATAVPTGTASATATATAVPTGTAAATATATALPTGTATATAVTTETPAPTATATPSEAIATATATGVPTGTATATAVPTGTATATVAVTATAPPSATPTDVPVTATLEPSATPTSTPTPTESPDDGPSDLAAVIDAGEVRLAWTNPDAEAGYTQALVLRRLNEPVDGPEDASADLIFLGAANTATHALTDLLPSVPEETRTYHYAVYACSDGGECADAPARATLVPTLPEALRGGGYVLHWRHASAPALCTDDKFTSSVPEWWKSCFNDCSMPDLVLARQLSSTGRDEAEHIGAAADHLRIAFSRVLSSEFCRNVETAQLMDFGPPIEQLPEITYFVYDEPARCASSYALLDDAPLEGTNTAIIGQAGFVPPCPTLSALAWAEAAVFRPVTGGSTLVTRVPVGEWETYFSAGPSGLSASRDPFHVRLTWIGGTQTTSVRLLRRLNAPVDGPDDPAADVLFAGVADTVLDPLLALLPNSVESPAVYHYAIFGCSGPSCDDDGSATLFAR